MTVDGKVLLLQVRERPTCRTGRSPHAIHRRTPVRAWSVTPRTDHACVLYEPPHSDLVNASFQSVAGATCVQLWTQKQLYAKRAYG